MARRAGGRCGALYPRSALVRGPAPCRRAGRTTPPGGMKSCWRPSSVRLARGVPRVAAPGGHAAAGGGAGGLGRGAAGRAGAAWRARPRRCSSASASPSSSTPPGDYGAYAQVFALFLVAHRLRRRGARAVAAAGRGQAAEPDAGAHGGGARGVGAAGLEALGLPGAGASSSADVLRGWAAPPTTWRATIPAADGAAVHGDVPRSASNCHRPTSRPSTRRGAGPDAEHFAPGHVALGAFDHLTFGVPLGFYYLAAGTAHGLGTLTQGQYEQATRELAPAALLVALYAGGKGARYLAPRRRAGWSAAGLQCRSCAWRRCGGGVERWRSGWGWRGWESWRATSAPAGKRPCSWEPEESRPPWRCTRREATWPGRRRGLAEARPEAQPGRPRRAERLSPEAERWGGVASLVDEAAGHSAEVVEAKLRRRSWKPRARACPRTWRC